MRDRATPGAHAKEKPQTLRLDVPAQCKETHLRFQQCRSEIALDLLELVARPRRIEELEHGAATEAVCVFGHLAERRQLRRRVLIEPVERRAALSHDIR